MSTGNISIDRLQTGLAMELTAVHQYLLHAHVLEDWGLDRLAAKMREEMQEELGHASAFIDRLLFLGATPVLVAAKEPKAADSLTGMFQHDLEDEEAAVAFYSKAAGETARDIGTRLIFERLAVEEENHMDWLKRQIDLVNRMGEGIYMANQMSGGSTTDADGGA